MAPTLLSADAPGAGPSQAVPVAYIGGMGRSGSTLLDRILGQIDGVCAVGELVHLWERGVAGNQLCGCGSSFHDCPFWARVGTEAFGGWERVDAGRALALQRAVSRHRYLPLLFTPGVRPSFDRRVAMFGRLQERIYRAIRRVSGCRLVVDSSKEAPYAFTLSRFGAIRLSVIHLVRDSRGVAHSWSKRVVRPEVSERTYMPRYRPAKAAAEWLIENVLFKALSSRRVRRLLVRYETLAEAPLPVLGAILRFLDASDPHGLEFLGDGWAVLGPSHSVSGNPIRFSQGRVVLRVDDDWRRRMPWVDRALVSAVTWPMLSAYGYRR